MREVLAVAFVLFLLYLWASDSTVGLKCTNGKEFDVCTPIFVKVK